MKAAVVAITVCCLAMSVAAATDRSGPGAVVAFAPIATPRDVAYPGEIHLSVDASDVSRRIIRVHETVSGIGGFLGDQYDAFKTGDPAGKVPDVTASVAVERDRRRLEDLDVLEKAGVASGHAFIANLAGSFAIADFVVTVDEPI